MKKNEETDINDELDLSNQLKDDFIPYAFEYYFHSKYEDFDEVEEVE